MLLCFLRMYICASILAYADLNVYIHLNCILVSIFQTVFNEVLLEQVQN